METTMEKKDDVGCRNCSKLKKAGFFWGLQKLVFDCLGGALGVE